MAGRDGEAHVNGGMPIPERFSPWHSFLHDQPMRLVSVVTAINVLVAAGFSIAGLVSPNSILPTGYVPTEASLIFAMYAATRSIPVAFMALIAIYKQSRSPLLILGTLAGFIQLLDAGVGLLQHDSGNQSGLSRFPHSNFLRYTG